MMTNDNDIIFVICYYFIRIQFQSIDSTNNEYNNDYCRQLFPRRDNVVVIAATMSNSLFHNFYYSSTRTKKSLFHYYYDCFIIITMHHISMDEFLWVCGFSL